jgi:putative restriction endonuclease
MMKLVDQRERAKRAWEILAECTRNKQSITYGELGRHMGVYLITCRFFLGLIQDHCHKQGLPLLNSLVVNKGSGRPGHGCIATSEDIQAIHQQIYASDWRTIPNPF